ncbi:MAG: redoxin domain-containing protein [Pseudonocardiaceae bacterium]
MFSSGLGLQVFGVSTDQPTYQQECAERLSLPFPLLSDARLELAEAWRLPVFEAAGRSFLRRLTLLLRDGVVERVWYPVFPPDRHAREVIDALRR